MDNEIRDLLEGRIEYEFEELSTATGEKRKAIIEDISTLYKLKIEEDRTDIDFDDKHKRRLMEDSHFEEECRNKDKELELKEKQIKDQRITNWITVGVTVLTPFLMIFAYDKWDKRHMYFEEHGTITTPEGKNLISKMLPKLW